MTDLDVMTLREAYDNQLKAWVPDPLPAGATVERDGPLVRILGLDHGGFLGYRDLGGLTGAALDELIARQVEFFRARGESVEWKLHGHDEPADLPDRLRAAGFVPEERETVVIGPVAPLAATLPVLPDGVRLREVTARADLDRIVAMEEEVWGDSRGHLADGLEKEIAADPQSITVVVAEAGETVVSAGWVRYVAGTGFATLWGGSTLEQWRRRGVYRALVGYRARLAAQRGRTLLQVDASEDSRPILERLGLVPITTTTPYVYTP
ncbi:MULTISPECIES: GNAT family N-acetyltransferase [unclassified Micromonospora]|uniref:GNAT family N-acetyltransferase n=1 Tax=unclassified Micromonospora TaxID=2617518 RepID=UPI00363E87FC